MSEQPELAYGGVVTGPMIALIGDGPVRVDSQGREYTERVIPISQDGRLSPEAIELLTQLKKRLAQED